MAKTRKKKTPTAEQLDLIDVAPENAKEILAAARSYRAAETERMAILKEEVKHKEKIIELVRKANIPADPDGKTRFKSGKIVITLEPRDMLVKITEKKDKKKKSKKDATE